MLDYPKIEKNQDIIRNICKTYGFTSVFNIARHGTVTDFQIIVPDTFKYLKVVNDKNKSFIVKVEIDELLTVGEFDLLEQDISNTNMLLSRLKNYIY